MRTRDLGSRRGYDQHFEASERLPALGERWSLLTEAEASWIQRLSIERAITFYDPVRLSQSMNVDLACQGYFAERIIVVPRLTREAAEAAVRAIGQHGFTELS